MQNKIINKISPEVPNKRFTALINLLEDDNSDIASSAISELLAYGKNLESLISELQESPNYLLRQRIHQLQAIVTIRKNRERLVKRLKNKHTGLWQGLNELHLLWYDNDSHEDLKDLKKTLIEKSLKLKPVNSKALATFMKEMTFVCSPRGDIEPDCYCIGSVLDSKVGADFILCAIAQSIAGYHNFRCKIAFSRKKGFIIIGQDGDIILPTTWKTKNNLINDSYKIWSTGMILRHTLFQLYLCAVSADSYRYTYAIGKCLTQMLDLEDSKDLFPYPYNFA